MTLCFLVDSSVNCDNSKCCLRFFSVLWIGWIDNLGRESSVDKGCDVCIVIMDFRHKFLLLRCRGSMRMF
ncbi:hypothetical protein APHNYW_0686 [Anaplasma phagocytophilum str. ApNYW]|nr:hypothetical protein APHNYW_0686 [Anaplasma phagocytophilum str. ApNYW]